MTIQGISSSVGFDERIGAGAIPVDLIGLRGGARGSLGDALAIAVVEISQATSGREVVFGVVGVGCSGRRSCDEVSCCVIGIAGCGDLILGGDRSGEVEPTFLGAADVL